MKRVEAYHILAKMWDGATPEQREAIGIATADIEFVDLMPNDMVAVVRCGNCKFCKTHKAVPHCIKAFAQPEVGLMDFCSHGERRNPNDHP